MSTGTRKPPARMGEAERRRRILILLCDGPRSTVWLAEVLDVALTTAARSVAELREEGHVTLALKGRHRLTIR